MIEKFKQARRGRPPKSESDRLDQRSVRLTTAQWKRLESRGGLEWLRALIDGAAPASAAVPASFQWALTPHICRQCFGRVLARQDGAFRCACCGEEGAGETEAVICCCGLKLEGTKDMGMRCQINEERTPEWLGEIVATALPLATPPRDHISS